MNHRTCPVCEVSIEGRHGRAIYCSRSCSAKAGRLRDPAAHKRDQAKYRASAKGERARRTYRVERTCLGCGETWLTEKRNGKYCSYLCRDYHRWGPRFTPWSPACRALALYISPAPRVTTKPVWVSGPCGWCASQFTTYTFTAARYCSDYCCRRAAKARRRARETGAGGTYTWGEVTRLWMLIGKRCAYCHEAKRNDEIEPDHVHPLSKGGSNSITNVVPACHPCNGDKRDLLLEDWYADRARRGLDPRSLHPHLATYLAVLTPAA